MELLSLCPEKLHCLVPLETLIVTSCNFTCLFYFSGKNKLGKLAGHTYVFDKISTYPITGNGNYVNLQHTIGTMTTSKFISGGIEPFETTVRRSLRGASKQAVK